MALDRSSLLKISRKVEPVAVPEWGGTVHIREISISEKDSLEGSYDQANKSGAWWQDFRARLLVLCICDEQGNRLFSNDDVSKVAELPACGATRVWEAAATLNRLRKDDQETLEKN